MEIKPHDPGSPATTPSATGPTTTTTDPCTASPSGPSRVIEQPSRGSFVTSSSTPANSRRTPGSSTFTTSSSTTYCPWSRAGLNGCAGALINSMPDEIDCKAAGGGLRASPVQSGRRPSDQGRLTEKPRLLPHPPAPPETLPARMVAFAYREAVERTPSAATSPRPRSSAQSTATPRRYGHDWKRASGPPPRPRGEPEQNPVGLLRAPSLGAAGTGPSAVFWGGGWRNRKPPTKSALDHSEPGLWPPPSSGVTHRG
jgi:hypothetical protein